MPTERMKRSETQLKPCPFCGVKAKLVVDKFDPAGYTYGVKCLACKASTNRFYSKSEAELAWNRRVKE